MENSECIATKNKQIHPIGSFPHMLKLLIRLLQSTLLFEVESKVNPFDVGIYSPECRAQLSLTVRLCGPVRALHRYTPTHATYTE